VRINRYPSMASASAPRVRVAAAGYLKSQHCALTAGNSRSREWYGRSARVNIRKACDKDA
jgi:hypothetical protein